jgi:AraC-like DNA-binding protein
MYSLVGGGGDMMLPIDNPIVVKRLNFHLRLRKVVSYLEEHLGESIHLHDASAIACMEKTAFSKFFRRTVGLSFHEFVLAWRVKKAVELMTQSDYTLSEISDAVGFETLVSLEPAFKRFFGCSPSRYRKQILTRQGILARN